AAGAHPGHRHRRPAPHHFVHCRLVRRHIGPAPFPTAPPLPRTASAAAGHRTAATAGTTPASSRTIAPDRRTAAPAGPAPPAARGNRATAAAASAPPRPTLRMDWRPHFRPLPCPCPCPCP